MSNLTKHATKLMARSIGITIFGCLGLLGMAMCGIDRFSISSISQAQDVEPGGKGGKGQPGAKGQKGGKGQGGFQGGGFPGMQGGGSIDSVKTQIKATDEEWKVIGPKLREVITARRGAETGMGGDVPAMRAGFAGPGGGGFGPPGGGGFGPPGGGGGPGGFGPPGGGPGGFGPPGGGGFGPPGGGGPGGGFGPPNGPGGRGPGGFQPPGAPGSPSALLDVFNLTAEQKKQVETLQKELETKIAKILTEEQNKQSKEMREGRAGLGVPPFTGPILSPDIIQKLNLSVEQKTQVESAQKDFDSKLARLLTEEQNKQLTGMREAISRLTQGQAPGFGPGGPPAFGGGGPPGFGGGNAGGDSSINQALSELQEAIDDPKTSPTQLSEKVVAVRAARKKARDKLEAVKKELLLLITSDQEAVLVRLGYLD